MSEGVKPESSRSPTARTPRSAATEAKLLGVATDLFVARGWRGTTLTDVADAAGVAARTVYVRFGSKGNLFSRVMDVAVVGDTQPVGLADRAWVRTVMTAPALTQRVAALAEGTTELFARLGPLLPALREAEVDEPALRTRSQAAREDTARGNAAFWTQSAADSMLPDGIDLDWVIPTSILLGAAETYLLMIQTLRWTPDQYRHWRQRTWMHLATASSVTGLTGR